MASASGPSDTWSDEKWLVDHIAVLAAFAVGCDKNQIDARQADKIQTETKQAANTGSEKACDALAKGFADARQWVSEKIAP